MPDFFQRITIVGTGLIGGSWGLALKRSGFEGALTGCDHPAVLKKALAAGAVDYGEADLRQAVENASLVILAAPVGEILGLIDQLKGVVPADALVTDVGSTKAMICQKARETFNGRPLFLGGHPLSGKERSGIENASADLFNRAPYVLTPWAPEQIDDARACAFRALVASCGARPVVMNAGAHDRAMAWLSHLPQLASTALGSLIVEEDGLPLSLAASGLRDASRLAGSPYDIWRDICSSNQENIHQALDALIRKLQILKDHLTDKTLEREFEQAQELHERLRENT